MRCYTSCFGVVLRRCVLLISGIGLFALAGCKKDLAGNSQTMPVNFTVVLPAGSEFLIRGLANGDSIRPRIKLPGQAVKDMDTSAYTFLWTVVSSGDTLSTRPYLTANNFDGKPLTLFSYMLTVRERKTGLSAQTLGSVFITTPTREGWMILSDRSGVATVGMLTYTAPGYKKTVDLKAELGLDIGLTGKPVSISAIGTDMPWNISPYQWVGIVTDAQIKVVESMDYTENQNMSMQLTNDLQPSPSNPIYLQKSGEITLVAWKGDHLRLFNNLYMKLGFPMAADINFYTTPSGNLPFVPAKVNSVYGPGRVRDYYNEILYDKDSCVFVKAEGDYVGVDGNMSLPLVLPFSLKGFQLRAINTNVGMDKEQDAIYALLNNPGTQETYLIQFLSNGIVKMVNPIAIPDAADMLNAQFLEIDFNTSYILYTKGNGINAYDFSNNQTFRLLDFGQATISLVKMEKYVMHSSSVSGRLASYDELRKKLVVCTWDPNNPGNSGTFHLFSIPLGHQQPIGETTETGFPRIVDATFVPIH